MNRQKKMLRKRKRKALDAEDMDGTKLLFKEGTAGVVGRWKDGKLDPLDGRAPIEAEEPKPYNEQP